MAEREALGLHLRSTRGPGRDWPVQVVVRLRDTAGPVTTAAAGSGCGA